ncbi:MAG: lysophospholipid acyltransferase family protein [Actinomycetota bacterium]
MKSKLASRGVGARIFYFVIRSIVVGFSYSWLGLKVAGRENLPTSGSYILAPTHRSAMDIPIAAAATRRRMRFMGKDSLWKIRPIGAALSALGGFPVTRGSADIEALKRCIAVLGEGEPLVLFPEGTRRFGDDVKDLFDGASFLAHKTNLAVVPVGIYGSEHVMASGSKRIRRAHCVMVIGKPIYPKGGQTRASREELASFTATLTSALQANYDEARRIASR